MEDIVPISEQVSIADKSAMRATAKGTIYVYGCNDYPVELNDVIYIPELKQNLLSVTAIDNAGFETTFLNGQVTVKTSK